MATLEELAIEISSNSTSAISGIDALSASLGRLKAATKGGVGLTTVANQVKRLNEALAGVSVSSMGLKSLAEALTPLAGIGKATNLNSTINALKKLPEVAKNLATIDFTAFTADINKATTALIPLANVMDRVSAGFSKFPMRIQQVITNNEKLTASNARLNKSAGTVGSSFAMTSAKLVAFLYVAKRAFAAISDWIFESNYFVENMNLFTVAMGEGTEAALAYGQTVQDALGIDMSQFIRNQGIFKQIVSGFGVANEKADLMSKGLTQIGYDLSSLYNISIEDSMQKVQSGIAGELEPLRRLGFALDQATLQQITYDNGIKQNVATMTQAQKSQLRYVAIMEQSSKAQGDMARTITSPANAIRILEQQIIQLKRALGNIFIPALKAAMPYVQAFVKILTKAAQAVANLFGFKLPEFDYSGLDGLSSGSDEVSEALDGASESASKLKKTILGFDQLNVMADHSSGAATDGLNGGYDLPIDLNQYDYDFIGEAESKANEAFARIKAKLEEFKGMFSFDFTNLKAAWVQLKSVLAPLSEKVMEDFGWVMENVLAPLSEWTISDAAPAFIKAVAGALDVIDETIDAVKPGLSWLWEESLKPLGEWTGDLVVKGLEGLAENLRKFADEIENNRPKFYILLAVLGIMAAIIAPIPTLIAIGIVALGLLINHWDEFKKFISDVAKEIGGKFEGLVEAGQELSGGLIKVLTGLNDFLFGVFTMDWKLAFNGIITFTAGLFQTLRGAIISILNPIIDIMNLLIGGLNLIKGVDILKIPVFKDSNLNQPVNLGDFAQVNQYAVGGVPDQGEMFIAREAGPELVGRIGSSAAVANNDQIVEAVSRGVAKAVSGVMASTTRGGDTFVVKVGDRTILETVITEQQRRNARAGRNVITLGV